ncbi:MAG: sulfite exporter TauE/SafE family protein, partial [Saprospiraceae bacterium]|nr:sulfite exporter TauE/SafE family protein [Saprospiraceae bacterium]
LMIFMAFAAWRFERFVTHLPGLGHFTETVKIGMGNLIKKYPGKATFSMGVLNGFLPCGLVYAAVAGAISTTDQWEGGIFMALFGFGTLPLLFSVSLFGGSFGLKLRKQIRVLQPVLMTLAGLLLIQRGLHLDLSLFESAVPKAGMDCH